MKKRLCLLLVLSLIFTLAACSANLDADAPESEPEEVAGMLEEGPGVPQARSQWEADEENDSQSEPDEEREAGGGPQVEVGQTAAATEEPSPPAAQETDDTAIGGKTLVVYISHTNTTATVAGYITDAIEADVFVIVPTNAYPGNYNEHLDMAQQELSNDDRPAIQSNIDNMDEYDIILLGYPIWWGYAPRPVATFLESHDLTNKTIAPFCTSGSSGMGQSAGEIARLAPGAQVVSGLSITGGNTGNGESLVRDWLSDLGLLVQ